MTPPPPDHDPQRPDAHLLYWAYQNGLFPMANPEADVIEWYSPDPRGVIPLDAFKVSKTLGRVVRSGRFAIRSDTCFEEVMWSCAKRREADGGTWIDETLVNAYVDLHRRGAAHSVEAWRDDKLVGGLYGVHIGGAFFGESMFVRPELDGTDSSKVCLVHLVAWMNNSGCTVLDTQFWNPHLDQFGCTEIPRDDYMAQLGEAVQQDVEWDLATR